MVSRKVSTGQRPLQHRRDRLAPWVFVSIYLVVNLLFVAKYAPRYGMSPFWACMAYGLLAAAIIWIADGGTIDRMLRARGVYVATVIMAAVVLLLLMLRVDPEGTRSGRYGAAHEWLRRVLHGEFPYTPPQLHSGFPFLFVLMLPFHLLGDVGLFQIGSFIVLALILRHQSPGHAASGMLLVVAAPAFLYEIAVRSDLFSNVVLVIGVVYLIAEWLPRASGPKRLALGILGGLVLSTRAIAFVVWIPYVAFVFRRRPRTALELLVASLATIAVTIVPFWLWDSGAFARFGPLTSERLLAQLPFLLGLVLILGAAFRSYRVDSSSGVFTVSGLALFVAAATSFGAVVAAHGLAGALWEDRFDITYFCFSLPLLLTGSLPLRAYPTRGAAG